MIDLEARKLYREAQKIKKLSDIEQGIKALAQQNPEEELTFHKGLTKAMLQRLDMMIVLQLNILRALKKGKK
ncbi:MAG: hypothetical protein C5B43_02295 [Verrucomicrobia bacterium]|nr:MAG: hypothetical protein C5B43_02295 [Verrucomicrobiota bacterium]